MLGTGAAGQYQLRKDHGRVITPTSNQRPVDGRVLRVFQESAAVVAAGAPLMEVGDPRDLEVVVDVLSSDAVKINVGDTVLLEEWGGDHPLHGRVYRVEPSGFTKISALGVEEQRVDVLVDLMEAPPQRSALADDYRVEARIIVNQADDVLKVPKPCFAMVNSTLYLLSSIAARPCAT